MWKSKNYQTAKILIFVLFLVGLLASCEPEDGAIGPAGPQGAAGLQGETGAQGPAGNPNIQVYQYTAFNSDWYLSGGSSPTWTFGGGLPGLTQSVLENSTVLFFWTQNGTQTLLPFTVNDVDYMYYTAIFSGNGSFQIQVSQKGPYLTVSPSYGGPVAFKVIIIPN